MLILVQAISLSFEIAAASFLAFLLYLILSDKSEHLSVRRRWAFAITSIFLFVLVDWCLWAIHTYLLGSDEQIQMALLAWAALWLFALAMGYFLLVRWDWPDQRVRYLLLLWGGYGLVMGIILIFLWWGKNFYFLEQPLKLDGGAVSQIINAVAQVAAFAVAATMVVITNQINARQADKTARQEIYQNLEIESIELFRFENQNKDLVEQLWFKPSGSATAMQQYLVKQYACQMLNLFEMAFRFRKDGIIQPDIFGSWIIWMWELCKAPGFSRIWYGKDGAWSNYIPEFSKIISDGVRIAKDKGEDGARQFFEAMSGALGNCEVARTWFDRPEPKDPYADDNGGAADAQGLPAS